MELLKLMSYDLKLFRAKLHNAGSKSTGEERAISFLRGKNRE